MLSIWDGHAAGFLGREGTVKLMEQMGTGPPTHPTPPCMRLCTRSSREDSDEAAGSQWHDRGRHWWNGESDRSVVGHTEMLGRTVSSPQDPFFIPSSLMPSS